MSMRTRGIMGVPMRDRSDLHEPPRESAVAAEGDLHRDDEEEDHFENPNDLDHQNLIRGVTSGGPRGGQQ